MKTGWKYLVCVLFAAVCLFAFIPAEAQCSVCTRTAQQLGEKPAKGLNAGILYLAFTPLALIGFIGYRWWKKNGTGADHDSQEPAARQS